MLQPLKIGALNFTSPIIQGPLAGVSAAPFRRLVWQYSQPAYTCTEMISCKTLMHQSDAFLQRFIYKDPTEGVLCFQLSGNAATEISEGVKKATAAGADLIDLNCGCPVKKIRSKRAGSQLLSDATRLYHIMCAMKQSTHVPVTVKIRVDGDSLDRNNLDIAKAVNDAGVDALIVHGRHWSEQYETPCRYDEIKFFVEHVNVPVIGNGDIACVDSLQKMLATGCHGVMVARAGVGQPWLIAQLSAEISQKTFALPTAKAIGNMFMQHVNDLTKLLKSEKFAIIESRKLAKYYARQLNNKNAFCLQMNECESLAHFQKLCESYFM